MPPPVAVMILLPLKEKMPALPKTPGQRPLYVAPSASAASSIRGTQWRLQR